MSCKQAIILLSKKIKWKKTKIEWVGTKPKKSPTFCDDHC